MPDHPEPETGVGGSIPDELRDSSRVVTVGLEQIPFGLGHLTETDQRVIGQLALGN